ncbi:MAG TPA: hypothetical protein VFT79_11435 [Solirubrobacterales bacterium]|nr:hypothetical protein [Solirubrobacterales bacterium]
MKVSISLTSSKVVGGDRNVSLANLGLLIPNGTAVDITAEGLRFSGAGIQLQREEGGGKGFDLPPEGRAVTVSLQPPATGRLRFPADWQAFELFGLCRDDLSSPEPFRGGELRYFHGPEGDEALSYPLFKAIPSDDEGTLALDVELDPLAPFDGERTRMLFREPPAVLGSAYGYSTAGDTVTLTPLTEGEGRAGFHFACRPDERSRQPAVYLAPLGSFELGLESGKEGEVRLMCGTSGLEYLAAATGDRLAFVPGQPAFSPDFGSKTGGESGEPLLQPPYTTSWAEFAPQGLSAIKRAYFGQPDASPNYGLGVVPSQDGKSMTLPAAVASRVRGLADGSNPFPLALYGRALTAGGAPAPAVDALMAFENFALAPERGVRLRRSAPGGEMVAGAAEPPPAPPVFSDATGAPLKGGETATPQGFVVGLNDGSGTSQQGTWKEVRFARSGSGQMLTVPAGSEGVVDPWLSTSLVKDQLFMVLNDWSKLPALDWLLSVGGFDFRMAPKAEEWAKDEGQTVLVFKYATSQSLADLIRTAGAWTLKEHFVGDEAKVAATQKALEKALEVAAEAEKKPNDPFKRFREIANSSEWTGMLAFNCLVPGTGMPADMQMLYAGIEGQLRAHHFGVELNRITRGEGKAEIAESSLFGAIYYQGTPKETTESPPDFEFTLRELEVTIRNSAVTEFHATVLLRANELFGREVALAPATDPPNTITLAGQYQRHGAVGTVTFALADPKEAAFDFSGSDLPAPPVRVLEAMSVNGASLVPVTTSDSVVTAEGQVEAKKITAQVTLEGALSFAEAPIPGAPDLDLFSYGDPGVGFSGFGLKVSCTIFSDGTRGPTTIKPDLSAVVLRDLGEGSRRAEGLVSKLPLTLKGLLHDEGAGLDPTKLGALPVNVVELAGPQGRTASSPSYALQFSLPLGTLGGLADAHASLEATLILGWGPSAYTPDDDGIGVFVQLPFISAGAFGLDLQGLLKTTFGDANLMRVETAKGPTYVVLFNNIAISVLGMKFPPRVIVDFILFAGPETKGSGNLGWSLAAAEPSTKETKKAALTERVG